METSVSLRRRCGSGRRAGGIGRFGLSALALAAVLLGCPKAEAQTKEELAKARELFLEGVALASGNNCAGAIAKYKEVARVKMTPQVAFNIAECEERLGKLVSALGNYRLAQSQLDDPKVRAKAKDVASQIEGRISALEERLPKLLVKRGKGADTATIWLDATELGSAQIGSEIPIDPGPHELVAKIGEKEASRKAVTITEKESKTVEVEVDLAALNKVDKPAIGLGSNEPSRPPTSAEPDKEKGGSKVPGLVVMGVGVASLTVGAVLFFGPRQSTISELETKCGGDKTCPPSAQAIADKGRLFTGVAEVAAAVGVVGVATGIVLLVTSGPKKKSPDASQPAKAASIAPLRVRWGGASPGADVGGISFAGSF